MVIQCTRSYKHHCTLRLLHQTSQIKKSSCNKFQHKYMFGSFVKLPGQHSDSLAVHMVGPRWLTLVSKIIFHLSPSNLFLCFPCGFPSIFRTRVTFESCWWTSTTARSFLGFGIIDSLIIVGPMCFVLPGDPKIVSQPEVQVL